MSKMRRNRQEPSGVVAPPPSGFHSLLVAVDLTPSSDRVLGRVPRLPLTDDARVTLLHVVPESLPAGDQRRAERDAKKALATEARHLISQLGKKVRVDTRVRVGAAAKEIAECSDELEAELVVMGRGTGRGLRAALLGSTAERVVRRARRPVLVVRLPARSPYSRPALALDRDEAAEEVVRLTLLTLPPPRPRVLVFHAFSVPYEGMIYPSLSEDDAQEQRAELRSRAVHELSTLVSGALAKAGVAREDEPPWSTQVLHGSPRLVIGKAIQNAEPDLLVLGTHGYSGAAYVLLGTVAGDLLRAAPCDVLIVPPPSHR